jgi:lipopolysaccharide transport system permease protein
VREEFVVDSRPAGNLGLAELWRYRHLAVLMAYRNVRVRYKQALLGFLWAVLVPVAFALVFHLFFRLAPVNVSGNLPYLPVVFIGMIIWQFFSRVVQEGGTSLAANAHIIGKVYFPRTVLPLSCVLAALFDLAISFVPLFGLLIHSEVPIGASVALAPLYVLWIAALAYGLSLILASVDAIFRDLRHAMPILLQLGMFASPVAYMTSALVPPRWLWLYELNPLVAPLEGLRQVLLPAAPAVDPFVSLKSLAMTLLVLILGTFLFSRVECTVVDRV